MACDEAALSAYLDGELSDADRRRLEAHLGSCSACSAALLAQERVRTLLDRGAVPQDLHSGLMARIERDERKRRRWTYVGGGLAAAVLAAAVLPAVWRSLVSDAQKPANAPAPRAAAPMPAPAVGAPTVSTMAAEATTGDTDTPSFAAAGLPLVLKGTVEGSRPQAVIATRAGGTGRAYAIGEEVLPGVRLDEVRAREVILNDHGTARTLALADTEAPERPRLDGMWRLTDPERPSEEEQIVIAERNGAIAWRAREWPDELPDGVLRVSGRNAELDWRHGNTAMHGQGAFDAGFGKLDLTVRLTTPPDPEQGSGQRVEERRAQLVRMDDPDVRREAEEREARREQDDVLRAMYAPLRAYAEEHEGSMPAGVADLVPRYAADGSLYEDTNERDVDYRPGGTLVASLPDFMEARGDLSAKQLDLADRLAALEESLRDVWRSDAPFHSVVLDVTFREPSRRCLVQADGRIVNAPAAGAEAPAGDRAALVRQRRGSSQNNLKQLGIIVKMFQGENQDLTPPGWLCVYPEYLTDTSILTTPWDEPLTLSYEYPFPLATTEQLAAYAREREGADASVDADSVEGRGLLLSLVPLVYERTPDPLDPAGRNVLFADGHVEWVANGEWSGKVARFLR